MANETMGKFGYPASLVREYEHWVILVRPAQVTLGSLVLAAKGDATAFGDLPAAAHAELALITGDLEATLSAAIGYQKINYLMLMMVDPHVHFHVFPRYEGARALDGLELVDAGWPGPPDLKTAVALEPERLSSFRDLLTDRWLSKH